MKRGRKGIVGEGNEGGREMNEDSAREGKIGVALCMDFRGGSSRLQYGNASLSFPSLYPSL